MLKMDLYYKLPLSWRLLVPVNLLLGLLLLIITVTATWWSYYDVSEINAKTVNLRIEAFSQQAARIMNGKHFDLLEPMSVSLAKDGNIEFIAIKSSDGSELVKVYSRYFNIDKVAEEVFRPIDDGAGKQLGSILIGLNKEIPKAVISRSIFFWVQTGIISLLVLFFCSWLASIYFAKFMGDVTSDFKKNISNTEGYFNALTGSTKDLSETIKSVNDFITDTKSDISNVKEKISQSAEKALNAKSTLDDILMMTNLGNRRMNELGKAIKSIRSENQRIREIAGILTNVSENTAVIHDIVFKTQLLSFNASIEAARAGAHGKGFAVVAEEVGYLAQDSGVAAEAITSILGHSKKQAEEIITANELSTASGETVTDAAVKAFSQISSKINSISASVNEILMTSRDQKNSIEKSMNSLERLHEISGSQLNISGVMQRDADMLHQEHQTMDSISRHFQQLVQGDDNALGDDERSAS